MFLKWVFLLVLKDEITTDLLGKNRSAGDKLPNISKHLDVPFNLLIFIGYVGDYIRPTETGCSSSFCI